ncbi:Oxygen-independent coproporphyrinogen-III oxidase [Acinetobacter baumannii]|nr:Oxygen-independent coproporphyrinogen-III oxidase [Acinetobacter baumannii]
MDIVSIKNFIQKNKVRHLSNKVLHTHPSPKMWKTDLKEEENNYFLLNTDAQYKSINLYLGIPYCIPTDPPHCGFCLFPTQDYKGKREMDFYLDFLSREAHLYKEFYQGAKLESLYVGGGTPNLLQPNDYMKLTKVVSSLFPDAGISSPIEMTLEGIPQLFNEDKIRAIKDAGFNRVSMGVQQVNDELIATSGRKQTRKQVFDAIELFH